MTRMSKQGERRAISRKRPRPPQPKTGPKSDNLPKGYKDHPNAVDKEFAQHVFIPKIK